MWNTFWCFVFQHIDFNPLNQSQSTNWLAPSVVRKRPSLQKNWCFLSPSPGAVAVIYGEGNRASEELSIVQSFGSRGGSGGGTGLMVLGSLCCTASPEPGDCKASCEQPLLSICFFVFCASPGVQSLLLGVAMAEHSTALKYGMKSVTILPHLCTLAYSRGYDHYLKCLI